MSSRVSESSESSMISKNSKLSTISRRHFFGGLVTLAAAPLLVRAQAAGPRRFGDGRDWFFEKRLGLFIHWGIYAVGGWHEQHMYRKRLSRAEYAPFLGQFNPVKFEPERWLDLAQEAGMGYLTFTCKHIDGFCMWDTRQTEYKVTRTPYGKDTLARLAEACHKRKFPLCLYYSCADMHHPNYPNAGRSYELRAPEPGDAQGPCAAPAGCW